MEYEEVFSIFDAENMEIFLQYLIVNELSQWLFNPDFKFNNRINNCQIRKI